jgi:hypothetical protein
LLYNSQKEKYNKTKSREDLKALLQILEQLRKETDGDKIKIEGSLDLNVQSTVNEHLRNEVFKFLPLREIILARIASRMNLRPAVLLKSLNDSYYSKFSKFLDGSAVDADEVQVFPSNQPYDFNQIEKYHDNLDREKKLNPPEPIVVEEKTSELQKIILNKIKQKQTNILTAEIENEVLMSERVKKPTKKK